MADKLRHSKIIAFVDGASRGNPGKAAIAGLLFDDNGNEIERFAGFIGENTNNVAEYLAIKEALTRAQKYNPEFLVIKSDSELVVRQLNGEYKVKDENLKKLYEAVKDLESKFSRVEYIHIKREENFEADRLCNSALDRTEQTRKTIPGYLEVTIVDKFDCAHNLYNYEGKCSKLHGHTYKVELSVRGTQLKEGILIDIVDLKKILKEILSRYDHVYLNEIEEFREVSPTAENLAIIIAEKAQKKLPPGLYVASVKVYESESAFVTFVPGRIQKYF